MLFKCFFNSFDVLIRKKKNLNEIHFDAFSIEKYF